MPKVVMIQGASGSGKTTLINQLLAIASKQYKHLGIIKSCGHEISIDADISKDSQKFLQAGARKILLHQGTHYTLFTYSEDTSLPDLILSHFSDFDLVFVEGFASSNDYPRIVIMRSSIAPKPLIDKQQLIAIASDTSSVSPYNKIPMLNLNDPSSIYSFILSCPVIPIQSSLKINGQVVPMNHFVQDIVINTVLGLVKNIKREDRQDPTSLTLNIHISPPTKKEQA